MVTQLSRITIVLLAASSMSACSILNGIGLIAFEGGECEDGLEAWYEPDTDDEDYICCPSEEYGEVNPLNDEFQCVPFCAQDVQLVWEDTSAYCDDGGGDACWDPATPCDYFARKVCDQESGDCIDANDTRFGCDEGFTVDVDDDGALIVEGWYQAGYDSADMLSTCRELDLRIWSADRDGIRPDGVFGILARLRVSAAGETITDFPFTDVMNDPDDDDVLWVEIDACSDEVDLTNNEIRMLVQYIHDYSNPGMPQGTNPYCTFFDPDET